MPYKCFHYLVYPQMGYSFQYYCKTCIFRVHMHCFQPFSDPICYNIWIFQRLLGICGHNDPNSKQSVSSLELKVSIYN